MVALSLLLSCRIGFDGELLLARQRTARFQLRRVLLYEAVYCSVARVLLVAVFISSFFVAYANVTIFLPTKIEP
jgi:hypothetical protein